MRIHFVTIVVALIFSGAALAQDSKQKIAGDKPPRDLSAYSLRFWPLNSLRYGAVVSTQTPYGYLTCQSIGTQPRVCFLNGPAR